MTRAELKTLLGSQDSRSQGLQSLICIHNFVDLCVKKYVTYPSACLWYLPHINNLDQMSHSHQQLYTTILELWRETSLQQCYSLYSMSWEIEKQCWQYDIKLVDHKNNVYSRLSQVGENLGWVRLHAAVSWAVTGQCPTNGLTPTLTLICGAGTVSPITAQETAPRNPTRPAVSTDLIITA